MNWAQLMGILRRHVLELKFNRRNNKYGWNSDRRMLCSCCPDFLNSVQSKLTLKYPAYSGNRAYNPSDHSLIFVYDILILGTRSIPIESVSIIQAIPIITPQDQIKFWMYFKKDIYSMSQIQKYMFMNE